MDVDGDEQLTIMDLDFLKDHFSQNTTLGQGVEVIYQHYMDRNVRPKHVKQKTIIDYQDYFSVLPNCELIKDFQYALNQRLFDEQLLREVQRDIQIKNKIKRKAGAGSGNDLNDLNEEPEMDPATKETLKRWKNFRYSFEDYTKIDHRANSSR